MAMISPVTFRLDADIIKALDDISAATNLSRSDIMREAIIEKLEDMYDIEMADKAYQRWLDSGKKTYSHEEAMRRYG
ncbi:type II toxin-antitoxin system RelB family antitoxin [Streptococcus suis]|uniref:type II toxin-antitoxin system RelB family antitoxin n=1 Tax=Streptococcus suis TaxID=1307 RepID=UPI003908A696